MITLTIETSQEVSCAAGAIFGRQDPRIVRINKFTLEAVPEGHMLILCTHDKPGIIGNIGTVMGDNLLNIARLHFSREQVDQQAMVVLSTDTMVATDVLAKLRGLPHVISVLPLEM
jgi:D-3-phosphoglycerate dehydrogenase